MVIKVSSLDIKLLRDMNNIKGQMLAIALVIVAGISVSIIMNGINDSLALTKDTYYDRYEFADVFASLKRAPESVKSRVAEIPDVLKVETRVAFGVTLQMDNMVEPGSGRVLSIPDNVEPGINKLYLRKGRYPEVGETDAVLVDEGFFVAHRLKLGDKVNVIMNGYRRYLKVVGVALSPEFVYSIAPGAMMPDPKRFAVFWMKRKDLEAAVNMKGAFNDVLIKAGRNANVQEIKYRLDLLLKPYGGLLSIERKHQTSNFFLSSELEQLKSMGRTVPIIFLAVAAFLINMVITRQISTQRVQIGMLKAMGFSSYEIITHFLKFVMVIVVFGAVLGLAFGTWAATSMIQMYGEFFHFPILQYSFSIQVLIFSVFSCALAALIGTLFAVRKIIELQPAVAMRPESPEVFKHSLLDKLGVYKVLTFLGRIVLRQIERRPIRSALSTLGMALAMAILVFSFQMSDTINHMMDLQYQLAQREDLNITFTEPKSSRAIEELRNMPGVLLVEPQRDVPVEFISGHITKKGLVSGLVADAQLKRVLDSEKNPVSMPESGLVINSMLAIDLNIKVGDRLIIQVLEAKRPTLEVTVAATTEEFLGMGSYLPWSELSHLLDESPRITGANFLIDSNYAGQLYQELKEIPAIIGLNITSVMRQIFEKQMDDNLLKMMGVIVLFASFISIGVVYNTARISLSERGRELASLRVLGLTRKEVAFLLFGELSIITVLAIPMGIWMGDAMAASLFASMESEVYRIPSYSTRLTYGMASVVILLSALVSFYLVWRRVDAIDLVSAQKGVE